MSGSNKKFYLPAGYSSSEDEFSENDEDEENISYSNPKVVQATVQLAAAAPLINSQFVWTRDTCAKRAVDFCSKSETEETDRKQAVSEKRTDSKTLKDVQSGEDCALSKPSKKKAVAAGAGSGLSDLINWSWVDKIIKDEANTSSVFQGSKEVDQMWLNRIACASKQQKGNLQGMVKQLCDCWKEVINPHSTTLFMLENMNVFEGKKPNILISLLKAFDQWLTKSSDTKTGHLSHSIQLRAFALLIREPVPVPHGVDLLSKCYQLNQLTDHAPFLTLIRQILEKKDYLKASGCISALKFHGSFSANQVSLPLLVQGHTGQLEEYLSRSRKQQIEFLQLLDYMISRDTDMDLFISQIDVPRIRLDLLTKKNLQKLAVRLMKNYQIADEVCPNVSLERASKALRYLFFRKYVQNDIGAEQWDELVQSAIDDDKRLQLELVDMLVDYLDFDGAASWALRCNIPLASLPHQVASLLQSDQWSNEAQLTRVKSYEVEDKRSSSIDPSCNFYSLPIPDDRIKWIDSKAGLDDCIDSIVKDTDKVVGFDAEWRPMVSHVNGTRLALVQLAVQNGIFLLDMIALSERLHADDWSHFLEQVLCNVEIQVVGYGVQEDVQMLLRSIPGMREYLSILNLMDLLLLTNQMRHLCPDALSKNGKSDSTERGLNDLVHFCLGRPLDKSQQVSNWERRPLRAEQIRYAALDAYCLIEVYKVLQAKIDKFKIPINLKPEPVKNVKKTKLELRQQRISAKCEKSIPTTKQLQENKRQFLDKSQEIKKAERENHTMAGNSEVKVVCDPTLTGLAQRLHSCGVDVLLLNSIDLVEKAAQLAHQEARILLASRESFKQLHFRWLPNKSYCVISHNLDEQVTEVLQHLHVSAAENLVLRCEVCNGDEYFNIHPAEMLYARQQMSTAPSDHGDNDSCGTMLDPTDVMKHEFDHLNLESLSLPNGLPLRPHSIPMTFFKDTTVFHVCANCGKIYSNKMKT